MNELIQLNSHLFKTRDSKLVKDGTLVMINGNIFVVDSCMKHGSGQPCALCSFKGSSPDRYCELKEACNVGIAQFYKLKEE